MGRLTDTFDMFAPPDRGRFGENEDRPQRGERVTGASDLHDLTLILKHEKPAAIAVVDSAKPHLNDGKWIWLPKSQVEWAYARTHGKDQAVVVTLPAWLARDKGLI
jgi:uncharacterized protein YecE (DUF72 family)